MYVGRLALLFPWFEAEAMQQAAAFFGSSPVLPARNHLMYMATFWLNMPMGTRNSITRRILPDKKAGMK